MGRPLCIGPAVGFLGPRPGRPFKITRPGPGLWAGRGPGWAVAGPYKPTWEILAMPGQRFGPYWYLYVRE